MDTRESQRYARQICEHSRSRRACGRVLRKFTTGQSESEAAAYIYDIVTLDFFQDIKGTMQDLLKELPVATRELLEGLLDESHRRSKEGELLDSDEDSEGNLM
jgi:hypothetical protein